METEFARIMEVGLDYITATSKCRNTSSGLDAFGEWLVAQEVAKGEKLATQRYKGYHGLRAGHAGFGRRYDGCLCRISGSLAAEHWSQCLTLADNVTRIDPQFTLKLIDPPQQLLELTHEHLLRRQKRRGRQPEFHVRYGPVGASSIEFGRRTSDRFGRVYDKFLQSRLQKYLNALRFELQLGKRIAMAEAVRLDQSENFEADVVGLVVRFLLNHGCRLPIDTNSREFLTVRGGNPAGSFDEGSGAERTLMWLSNNVRPAVERLVHAGRRGDVLEALGLNE